MPATDPAALSSRELLESGYDAFNRRDTATLRALMVDDFRWNEADEVPGRKVCRSADEFIAYVEGFDRLWAEFSFEILDLTETPQGPVIARMRGRGVGRAGDEPMELVIHHVWRFRDGRVARMDAFLDPHAAADAARGPA